MKTYIYLSDIHANYEALKHLTTLPEMKDENCEFRFGGDYIDGYDLQPNATLNTLHFIKNLCDQGKAKAIVGNHDQFIIDATYYPHAHNYWEINGRANTLENLGIPYSNDEELREQLIFHMFDEINWLKSLPYYIEDGTNLLTHAGFDLDMPLDEQDIHTMLWTRQAYIEFFHDEILRQFVHKDFKDKTIITGHTPTAALTLDIDTTDCPIVKDYEDEVNITRYYIDGGSKSGYKHGHINLIKLDENGKELWRGKMDEHGIHIEQPQPQTNIKIQKEVGNAWLQQ